MAAYIAALPATMEPETSSRDIPPAPEVDNKGKEVEPSCVQAGITSVSITEEPPAKKGEEIHRAEEAMARNLVGTSTTPSDAVQLGADVDASEAMHIVVVGEPEEAAMQPSCLLQLPQ